MVTANEQIGDNIRVVYPKTQACDVQKYVDDCVNELDQFGHEYENWALLQLKRTVGNCNVNAVMTFAGSVALISAIYMKLSTLTSLSQLSEIKRLNAILLFLDMVLVALFCLYQGLIKPLYVKAACQKAENVMIDVLQTRIYHPNGAKPVSRQECLDWLMYVSGFEALQRNQGRRLYLRFTDFLALVDSHRYELFCGLEENSGSKYLLSLEKLNELEESGKSIQYIYPSVGRELLIFRQSRHTGPDAEYYIHASERQIRKINKMNKDRGQDAYVVDLTFYDDIFKCIYADSCQEENT